MLLAACAAGCTAGRPLNSCQLVYAGQAPLSRYGARLLVPASVNGKPIALMLDTGAPVSLMSAPHATLLNLTPITLQQPAPLTISGLGGSRTVHIALADTMQVGTLHATRSPFVVPDVSPLRIVNRDPDTLGMNFLTGFDVDFDVLDHRLLFYKTGQLCTPHVLMPAPVYVAPEVFSPQPDRPIVTASIRGQSLRALLDTGSPESLLFRGAAERLGLGAIDLASDPRARLNGIGLNTIEAARHLSEPITVGGLTVSKMRVNISPEDDPAIDIVLGMDFLSKVHLWISNSSRAVVLQFPPKVSQALY